MHTNTRQDYFSPSARRQRMHRANENPGEDHRTLGAFSDEEIKNQRKAVAAAIQHRQRQLKKE